MRLLQGVDISTTENREIIEYNHKNKIYKLVKEHPLQYAYMISLSDWHNSNKHNNCIYLTK